VPRRLVQYVREPISLDQPIGEEGGSQLGEFSEDTDAVVGVDAVSFTLLQDQLQSVLATLSGRETGVVRLRFGLTEGQPRTLAEVGQIYGVTRERIRQIESTTMSKLRRTGAAMASATTSNRRVSAETPGQEQPPRCRRRRLGLCRHGKNRPSQRPLRPAARGRPGQRPRARNDREWARLNVCPSSCTAVQNFMRRTAAAFGSSGGGASMNDPLNTAVPWRWFGPMSSNMMPPRFCGVMSWLGTGSCCPANSVHTDHCATFAKRDQCTCIASCISMSDHSASAPVSGMTLGPVVTVAAKPARW
jgi:hypothetical protein